jgi:hypothetical protein
VIAQSSLFVIARRLLRDDRGHVAPKRAPEISD